jgi:hypothetical protein
VGIARGLRAVGEWMRRFGPWCVLGGQSAGSGKREIPAVLPGSRVRGGGKEENADTAAGGPASVLTRPVSGARVLISARPQLRASQGPLPSQLVIHRQMLRATDSIDPQPSCKQTKVPKAATAPWPSGWTSWLQERQS